MCDCYSLFQFNKIIKHFNQINSKNQIIIQIEELSFFFRMLFTEKEKNILNVCAYMGIMFSLEQENIRKKIYKTPNLDNQLDKVENFLSQKNGSFIGGDLPDYNDARLLVDIHCLFALMFLSKEREKFPSILSWMKKSLKCLSSIHGSQHMLDEKRIGNQCDCYADPQAVRSMADFSTELNSDYKLKKNQRQLEKIAKQNKNQEKVSCNYDFSQTISMDCSVEEKINILTIFFEKFGCTEASKYPVLFHPPAPNISYVINNIEQREGVVCKNLFLKAKTPRKNVSNDSCIWLISVPENKKINLKTISKALGYKDELRNNTPACLLETMHVHQNSLSPLGLINDCENKVNLILDEEMLSNPEKIYLFHALSNEATIGISTKELRLFLSAISHNPQFFYFEHLS